MTYYKIDIKGYSLIPGVTNAKEFLTVRRKYLGITEILWLVRDVEIDPMYDDCAYYLRIPVLIFLN